jgi:hypothetical protein
MVTSANQTLNSGMSASVTDSQNHVWTIVPGTPGRGDMIAVDGVLDPTTAFVTGLAYVENVVWQRNAIDNWYGKNAPTDTWTNWEGSAPPVIIDHVTPNATHVVGRGASIRDANGNDWKIVPGTPGRGDMIAINGTLDPTTGFVDELSYNNGQVWQKNIADNWYAKTSPFAPWTDTDAHPPVPISGVSPDATVLSSVGPAITDANGNVWTIVPGVAGRGNQIAVDGAVDLRTANITKIAYVNGALWQQNTAGGWWSTTAPNGDWTTQAGPPAGVSIDPPPPITPIPPTSLTWVGGGDNQASNSVDWSPHGVPGVGTALSMPQGTMNVSGDDLKGNSLRLGPATTVTMANNAAVHVFIDNMGNGPETFNASGDASLALAGGGVGGDVTVNLKGLTHLVLTDSLGYGSLTINGSGASTEIRGNQLAGAHGVLHTDLVGEGRIQSATHYDGAPITVDGRVASGITVAAGMGDVIISQAAKFDGIFNSWSVSLPDLIATSYSFNKADGKVTFFNNDTQVASLRSAVINPGDTYQAFRGASGVISVREFHPGGVVPAASVSGSMLPVHI